MYIAKLNHYTMCTGIIFKQLEVVPNYCFQNLLNTSVHGNCIILVVNISQKKVNSYRYHLDRVGSLLKDIHDWNFCYFF